MRIINYIDQKKQLPNQGRVINAYCENETILVYQAFKKSIADYAVKEQQFGGQEYSFNRMSWIKTSFLWMMYRSGWAEKAGQEHILAISISKKFFDKVLEEAVVSSFSIEFYETQEEWKKAMNGSEVRLQWDPDHDPFGKPIERKAIQLGLKGSILKEFASSAIIKIEDVTGFAKDQFKSVSLQGLYNLMVPDELIYYPADDSVAQKIGLKKLEV